jgi:hypothetical protein
VILRPLFPRSGSAVLTLMYVWLRCGSNTLSGCVSGRVSASLATPKVFCCRKTHHKLCNCISNLDDGSFPRAKNYINSPICCAVENRPQEIVFSQLTPPIGNAKVSSTCAAVPFGEVRSHSRVQLAGHRAAAIGSAQRSPDIPANRSRCYAQSGVISGRREGRFSRLGMNFPDPLGAMTGSPVSAASNSQIGRSTVVGVSGG